MASIPRLGPGAEALRLLTQMPVARLRAAAAEREIAIPSRATREQIARQLVAHSIRVRAETQYRETGTAFDPRNLAYPHVRRLVTRYRLRRLFDIGCGPGFFAEELLRSRALPADGTYVGVDVSPAAVELAQQRLGGDPRFTFRVSDAEQMDEAPDPAIDGIVVGFVLSYLDTHAVDRLIMTLARSYPAATLIVALTFGRCVDPLDGVAPDEEAELRAARRYLAGHPEAAEKRWDLRRLRHYWQSVETYYEIVAQRTLSPLAQMLWVAQPRSRIAKVSRPKPRKTRKVPTRSSSVVRRVKR